MTIFFTSIGSLFNTLHTLSGRANNLIIATQVAQQQLETYRNTPYNNIALGTVDYSSLLDQYKTMGSPKSVTVTTTQKDPNGLKQVDVTVQYHDHKLAKTIAVSTLIALNGINR